MPKECAYVASFWLFPNGFDFSSIYFASNFASFTIHFAVMWYKHSANCKCKCTQIWKCDCLK